MKTSETRFMVTAIAIVALLVSAESLGAQEIVFANGIGEDISQLTISPAKAQYPNDKNAFSVSVQINDKSDVSVKLPESFSRYDAFDIDVISNGKNYIAKRGVKLDFSKGTPLLELSESGHASTFPIIGALTGGVASIALLTTTRAGMRIFFDLTRDAWTWGQKPRFGKSRLLLGIPMILLALGHEAGKAIAVRCMDIQVAYLQ
ncbi:MAG: hypothetical protein FWB77_04660 [Treponema sp.]|nr:hypothetical protein [Treponema sp.]